MKAKPVERQGRKATGLSRQPSCLFEGVTRLFLFVELKTMEGDK